MCCFPTLYLLLPGSESDTLASRLNRGSEPWFGSEARALIPGLGRGSGPTPPSSGLPMHPHPGPLAFLPCRRVPRRPTADVRHPLCGVPRFCRALARRMIWGRPRWPRFWPGMPSPRQWGAQNRGREERKPDCHETYRINAHLVCNTCASVPTYQQTVNSHFANGFHQWLMAEGVSGFSSEGKNVESQI